MFELSRCIVLALVCALAGCASAPHVTVTPDKSNAVAYWHAVGAATVNVNATVPTATTEAEKYPAFSVDMATMHVAIYDAVAAITGRYQPLYAFPQGDFSGASPDAATGAAAFGVLRALFPDRAAHYRPAYDSFMASLPDGAAKTRGIALGNEVATAVLARRAADGRAIVLAEYVPGTAPGEYRGRNPVVRYFPHIRPFTLNSMDQFRPPPPPALDSAEYAADFNETKDYGGMLGSRRTPEQLELARFHTEAPQTFITRNFGRFARSTGDVGDAARLMAILYSGYTDAIGACFDAKYHYNAWRPLSAIPLAQTDDNPATASDTDWKPVLPTPPHPEYPAAHSCTAGAVGELLRLYFGTGNVSFTLDSIVTNVTRDYADVDALARESVQARIYGGMHFRYATTAGYTLGKQVAGWTMGHAFMRLNATK
ncbi:vanadium-dependent haloperoxidase [Oxalobacteraceae bacterium OTU3CINTB1]|nr:vanadium-dependent haloperoxidase [Oxalobacteraceae bacterium OTU3CINTB1]